MIQVIPRNIHVKSGKVKSVVSDKIFEDFTICHKGKINPACKTHVFQRIKLAWRINKGSPKERPCEIWLKIIQKFQTRILNEKFPDGRTDRWAQQTQAMTKAPLAQLAFGAKNWRSIFREEKSVK